MTYTVIGTVPTRTARVLWLLEELGQDYDHLPARPRSDEAVRANPSGKVPALVVDGVTLTDSTAILTFLADRHGQFTYPAGSVQRARQDGFLMLVLDEIEGLLWAASRHSFILPEAMRLPALKPVLVWEYERNIERLAATLTGPFLMGDQMTVPDIVLAHCLRWAVAAKFPAPAPVLADYLARMTARPAFERAMARGNP
jgi:glutathione S-transferase